MSNSNSNTYASIRIPAVGQAVVIRHSSNGDGKMERVKVAHEVTRSISAVYLGVDTDEWTYSVRDSAGEPWLVTYMGNDQWQTVLPGRRNTTSQAK